MTEDADDCDDGESDEFTDTEMELMIEQKRGEVERCFSSVL